MKAKPQTPRKRNRAEFRVFIVNRNSPGMVIGTCSGGFTVIEGTPAGLEWIDKHAPPSNEGEAYRVGTFTTTARVVRENPTVERSTEEV